MATERVSGHCAVLDHPNDGISLRESFRYHPYWLQLGTDLPSRLQSPNAELSIATPLTSSPTCLPIFSPPFLGPLVEWSHWVADGQMGIDSVPLRRKLIGRDRKRIAVSLNGPDMMGKSMQGPPVHLHTVRGPRLMFSLQGVIRSFGSTLTSWSDNSAWD